MSIKLKSIIPGVCKGRLLIIDRYLSFFGEIDPETGCLRDSERDICIGNRVLLFKGSRGSTVGPYVLYALKRRGLGPLCMITGSIEPLLIAGCVISEIPLYLVVNYEDVKRIGNNVYVEVIGDELAVYDSR